MVFPYCIKSVKELISFVVELPISTRPGLLCLVITILIIVPAVKDDSNSKICQSPNAIIEYSPSGAPITLEELPAPWFVSLIAYSVVQIKLSQLSVVTISGSSGISSQLTVIFSGGLTNIGSSVSFTTISSVQTAVFPQASAIEYVLVIVSGHIIPSDTSEI